MKKNVVKQISTAVLASSMVLGMGVTAMAAPKTSVNVTAAATQTEQNSATGVITPNPVTTGLF